METHARLFQRIAPIYQLFFHSQSRAYCRLLEKYKHYLPEDSRVLDIGCGPGALSSALQRHGFIVTGVDFAPAMVAWARKLNPANEYLLADGRNLPFRDKSFDLVTAAYVAHGLDSENRLTLYREAARLARRLVVFHDFNFRRHILISLIELVEGGNYFSFVREGAAEMEMVFARVNKLEVGPRTSWYICIPNKGG